MSVPRLPFLYPHIFKQYKAFDTSSVLRPLPRISEHSRRQFRTPSKRLQSGHFAQRYGPAAEPISDPKSAEPNEVKPTDRKHASRPPARESKEQESGDSKESQPAKSQRKDADTGPESLTPPKKTEDKNSKSATDAAESHPKESQETLNIEGTSKPLERVMHMEAPTSSKNESHKPPHLQAPPYVHHFDTYTLVKDLGQGGFTQDQSITIMKSVRSLLAENLELARDGLVSKSDIENETYLFRAACSELRTEVQNSRQTASDKMRSERTHLQHEVDILNQRVTQDSLTLKDDLKGMFDDRKMAVRMEQRSMESAIQELNYKITVLLQGDTKGEVEGLRWFLARRAAMFIASMAVLILGSLRYSTYMTHTQEQERKKLAASLQSSSLGQNGDSGERSASLSRHPASAAANTDAMLASLETSASPNYVSLG